MKVTLNEICDNHNTTLGEVHSLIQGKDPSIPMDGEARISRNLYQEFLKVFIYSRQKYLNIEKEYEVGTIVETTVVEKIDPSIILVSFVNGYFGKLSLQNIDYNLLSAQKVFDSISLGQNIKAVILQYDHPNKICEISLKHLRSANEVINKNYKVGEEVIGEVYEKFAVKSTVILPSKEFGIVNSTEITGSSPFIISGVSRNGLFLLSPKDEIKTLETTQQKKQEFNFIETDLQSFINFETSNYFKFASPKERELIREELSKDPKLFSKQFQYPSPLYIQFQADSPAWEIEFKIKFLYQIIDDFDGKATNEAINRGLSVLSNEKYWLRFNETPKGDRFTLFNEKIFIMGGLRKVENQTCLDVFSISLGQTRLNHSLEKKRSANKGTILYDSRIIFLSPYQNYPFDYDQTTLVNNLWNKFLAHQILYRLKKETGEFLRSEGESLLVFDRFLEYQISNIRNLEKEPFKIHSYKRVPAKSGNLSIEIFFDENELVEINSNIVRVLKRVASLKEKREYDYQRIQTAEFQNEGSRYFLSFKENIDLSFFEDQVYIQENISSSQFELQRGIIRDFFNKKINLDHIESLLLDPNRIKPPQKEEISFYNSYLTQGVSNNGENNQIKAVTEGVGNQNIYLIQGPPGTGKTTVIVEIIQHLLDRGERILVTSQTHVAVDNVLRKLQGYQNLSLLRIASSVEKIDPDLVQYHIEEALGSFFQSYAVFIDNQICLLRKLEASLLTQEKNNDQITTWIKAVSGNYPKNLKPRFLNRHFETFHLFKNSEGDELKMRIEALAFWKNDLSIQKHYLLKPLFYKSLNIAFGTCIGIKTFDDFENYNVDFDTVIIDEAGKVNLSESFVAMSMATKVILVGDQKQLPPYVDGQLLDPDEENSFPNSKFGKNLNQETINRSLSISFFEYLIDKIESQEFPASNFAMLNYQHRMHPNIGDIVSKSFYNSEVKNGSETYKNVLKLKPPFDKEVIFIDTSSDKNPYESYDGYSAKNELEASIIANIVIPELLSEGVSTSDFGIIAPYKSQVGLIAKVIESHTEIGFHDVNISTLDSFQGMEYDVIVFSFTRSARPNQNNKKVGFLDDARRLNVAFSRAKKKLILIGNAETLAHKESHYDFLFDYTRFYRTLIYLCKEGTKGSFIQLTNDLKLKSSKELFLETFKEGKTVNGRIKKVNPNFGIFVELKFGIGGLVGHYDIDWDENEVISRMQSYDEGDIVKVKIKKIQTEENGVKVFLSIKDCVPNPFWHKNRKNLEVGRIYAGQLIKELDKFYLIQILPKVTGILLKNDYTKRKVQQMKELPIEPKILRVRIRTLDIVNQKMILDIA